MAIDLKWDITYNCNLMCDHCINGHYLNHRDKELSFHDIRKIIDLIHEKVGIRKIQFLGGEPLTRNDFIDVLKYLDDRGILFGFNTNGLLINSKMLERLGSLQHFEAIILSLEGPNEEINDAIRGKKVYNILMDRIKLLIRYKKSNPAAKFKVCINTVITSQNYMYTTEMSELLRKEEVDEWILLQFIEEGNGVGKHLSLDKDQLLELVKMVAEEYTEHKDEKLVISPKFVRPMAIDYAKECLELEFPEIAHGCGAGSTLAFLV
ncbi:MAG: radical SAM protein [Eubacteriales bacterium]|nr:radical SAM protein [Eubacteriales bacterium]